MRLRLPESNFQRSKAGNLYRELHLVRVIIIKPCCCQSVNDASGQGGFEGDTDWKIGMTSMTIGAQGIPTCYPSSKSKKPPIDHDLEGSSCSRIPFRPPILDRCIGPP